MKALACILLTILSTGCATMVNGRDQTISVDSFPSGAAIGVDCGDAPRTAGVTPAKITGPRAAEYCRLTFTRPEYEPKVVDLTHQRSRATALNRVFGVPSAIVLGLAGALVGSAVDGADTGAQVGIEAGYDLGRNGATALDEKGGGMKWVPGRIFVVLTRPDSEEPADGEAAGAAATPHARHEMRGAPGDPALHALLR